jgi:Tfp pilus assembly protein PilO
LYFAELLCGGVPINRHIDSGFEPPGKGKFLMEQVQRFRVPVLIGVTTVVVVLAVLLAWISPEGNKLAAAKTTESSLVSKQALLQGEVDGLKADRDKVPTNCGELIKINTEIPADPDQAQFISELSTLAQNSGNPGTPTLTWGGSASSAASKGAASSAVTSVPFTLSLGGTYQQLLNFLDGIQNFSTINRLVTIGSAAISASGGPTAATIAIGPALAPQSASGYTLSISGDVYYNATLSTACDSLDSSAATPTTLGSVPPTTFPTPSTLPAGQGG